MIHEDHEDRHRRSHAGSGAGDDCEEAIHTLYHFLDGELTEQRRREIQTHLEECSPCLEAFDFEAELKLIIARKCRDQVPDSLRQRVHQALIEASKDPTGFGYPQGMPSV